MERAGDRETEITWLSWWFSKLDYGGVMQNEGAMFCYDLSAGYYAGCLPVHVAASLTCIAFQISSYTKQHSFSHKVSKSVE